jgi:hypothetical protein
MQIEHVGKSAMDNLRETIHENDRLNHLAALVRSYIINFFLTHAKHL